MCRTFWGDHPVIKIEIFEASASEKRGVSGSGKPYLIREQEGYAHLTGKDGKPERYPARVSINLQDGTAPYAPGMYTLGDASFSVGEFGALRISRMALTPLPAEARVRTA